MYAGPPSASLGRRRRAGELVQQSGGLDLPLEHRATERVLMIGRTEIVEHANDPVAAEIRGVAHRRAPVAG